LVSSWTWSDSPHYVRLGDWDDLRRGESPLAGHPGVVSYLPDDLPHTIMGWLIEPDGLYDLLRAIGREAPGLPLYITENGCAADDYVDPEAGSTTSRGSTTSTVTSTRPGARSVTASTSPATSCGR
jgi:hypothetical protein